MCVHIEIALGTYPPLPRAAGVAAPQALFGTLTPDVMALTVAYSIAGLGIAIVNDFKSIEGDRQMGLQVRARLPLSLLPACVASPPPSPPAPCRSPGLVPQRESLRQYVQQQQQQHTVPRPSDLCLAPAWYHTTHTSTPHPAPSAQTPLPQSLPVAFGVDAAKWICVASIDVTQLGVAAYLAWGPLQQQTYAAVLLALILPQVGGQPVAALHPIICNAQGCLHLVTRS